MADFILQMLQFGNLITSKEYAEHKFVVIIDVIAFVNIPVVRHFSTWIMATVTRALQTKMNFQIVIYRASLKREKKVTLKTGTKCKH